MGENDQINKYPHCATVILKRLWLSKTKYNVSIHQYVFVIYLPDVVGLFEVSVCSVIQLQGMLFLIRGP